MPFQIIMKNSWAYAPLRDLGTDSTKLPGIVLNGKIA